MNTETTSKLSITRVFQAPRDRVFAAWTEADQMKQWGCPEGATVADCAIDLRVGGAYHIKMAIPTEDGGVVTPKAFGTYREIAAPERLVYTWDWDDEQHAVGETLVTVEFRDMEGATEVVLTHDLFPAAEARDGHNEGWASCLNKLEALFDQAERTA